MPKIRTLELETLRKFAPFNMIWLENGRVTCLGAAHGVPVRKMDVRELYEDEGRYDVALTMEELEALLPSAAAPIPGRGPRLYVPLALLSEYLSRAEVETSLPRDPSSWFYPGELEEGGLEIVNGKLVKKQQSQTT